MNSIAAIPLKSCNQCSHYRGGYCYGFGTAKRVFSTAEAIFCNQYTPLGQVQIGPLGSLAGQLTEYQIPTGIISTIKLADLAVTSAKLADASVTLLKIVDGVITNAKIDAAAAIAESKLALNYPTHDNALDHAEAHTLASHSTKAHAELTDVTTSQHHVKTANDEVYGLLNSGLDASKGAASTAGKLYFATDTKILYRDNGTAWEEYLRGETVTRLASLSEKDHASLANVLTSQHHVKTVSGEISLADLLEKDHANLTNVLTSQHHVKYTNAEALAQAQTRVSDVAFSSDWNTVTDIAPSKNAVYDAFRTIAGSFPQAMWVVAYNGAIAFQGANGAFLMMPSADSDAAFSTHIYVPIEWQYASCYLKVLYRVTTANPYSVTWNVGAVGIGEVDNGTNILNGSTGYDFPTKSANVMAINSISLTNVAAGDKVGITCTSDSSNTPQLRIYGIWLSPNAGVDTP